MLTSLFSFLALVSVTGSYSEDEMSLLFFELGLFMNTPSPTTFFVIPPMWNNIFSRETSPSERAPKK